MSKLPPNSTSSIGHLQLVLNILHTVLENVSMKAALGHFGKPMHEAKDVGPPDAQLWDLC